MLVVSFVSFVASLALNHVNPYDSRQVLEVSRISFHLGIFGAFFTSMKPQVSARQECLSSLDILREIAQWLGGSPRDMRLFRQVNRLFKRAGHPSLLYNRHLFVSGSREFRASLAENPNCVTGIKSLEVIFDIGFAQINRTYITSGAVAPSRFEAALHEIITQISTNGRLERCTLSTFLHDGIAAYWNTIVPLFTIQTLTELAIQISLGAGQFENILVSLSNCNLPNLKIFRIHLSPPESEAHGHGNYVSNLARLLAAIPGCPEHFSLAFNYVATRGGFWETVTIPENKTRRLIWPTLQSLTILSTGRNLFGVASILDFANNIQFLRLPILASTERPPNDESLCRGDEGFQDILRAYDPSDLLALDVGSLTFVPTGRLPCADSGFRNVIHLRIRGFKSYIIPQDDFLFTLENMKSLRCLEIDWPIKTVSSFVEILEGRNSNGLRIVWGELRELVVNLVDNLTVRLMEGPMDRLLNILYTSRISMPKLLAVTVREMTPWSVPRPSLEFDYNEIADDPKHVYSSWHSYKEAEEMRIYEDPELPEIIDDTYNAFPTSLRYLEWRVFGSCRLYRVGWKVGKHTRHLGGINSTSVTPRGFTYPEGCAPSNKTIQLQRMRYAEEQIARGDTSISERLGSYRYAVEIPYKFAKKPSNTPQWETWTDTCWYNHFAGEGSYNED